MENVIKIGTRSSDLALWQANTVAGQLEHLGHKTEIVKIDSIGDVVLDKPLYELGITGVFTKNLDIALINGKIDIAVHSFKDVPTKLPEGVVQAAILKRGDFNDALIIKDDINFFSNEKVVIATGSLRRKAQWLYRYPNHKIVGLRGNVNTRLNKLAENDWDGAVFAAAGLKRLDLLPGRQKFLKLDWMVPAPAQGAVMVAAMEKNEDLVNLCREINDEETAKCVGVEREFLRVLEGGCTAPIGALATIEEEELNFKGVLFNPEGTEMREFTKTVAKDNCDDLGRFAAQYILDRGGKKLMREQIVVEREINVFSTKSLSKQQTASFSDKIAVEMSDFITIRHNRLKAVEVAKHLPAVIFTSQNAVEAVLQNFAVSDLDFGNIFCVGRRTKRLIEKKIGQVANSENSAEKLAAYLVKNHPTTEFTFFCGNLRRDDLPAMLEKQDVKINEVTVYQTLMTPNKIAAKYKGVLFFSPSGIESFIKDNKAGMSVAFCLGETTARTARKYFENIVVAKLPTVDNLIKSVNQYFEHE